MSEAKQGSRKSVITDSVQIVRVVDSEIAVNPAKAGSPAKLVVTVSKGAAPAASPAAWHKVDEAEAPVAPTPDFDDHTCNTPNYTDGPCYACAKEKVMEWVFERYENCQRIAKEKTGADRESWLEDGDYFMMILKILKEGSVKRGH